MKRIQLLSLLLIIFLSTNAQQNSLIKWEFETNGKVLSHPVISHDIVYFGSNDSNFYALNIHSGKQIWSFKTNSIIQSKALIKNHIIYFKCGNSFFALDKKTGREIWSFKSKSNLNPGQLDYWDYHSGAPIIEGSTIYVGLNNGNLYGFNLESGKEELHYLAKDSAAIKSELTIDNSILYFGDWNGKVYALDVKYNKTLWIYETYEKQLYSTFGQLNASFLTYKDLLYYGGRNHEMQVLDKNTGVKKWSYTEKNGGWISGNPEIYNDTLFIAGSDNHELFAFNAITGEKYWTFLFLNNNFSKPLIYKSYVIFTTGDAYNVYGASPGKGYLYAVNRNDGSIKNFAFIGGNIYTSLIEKDGILFMGSSDHNFYAIDLEKFLNVEPELEKKGHNSIEIGDITPSLITGKYQIKYKVNYKTPITIRINDLNEELVKNLYTGKKKAGDYTIEWDGKNKSGKEVDSGYYFIEISSGDYFKKTFIEKVDGK